MFKEIRDKKYNNQMITRLKNVKFDSFAYCGTSEYPKFVVRATENTDFFSITPETEQILYLAICKLKSSYIEKNDLQDFEVMLKVYCDFCGFSDLVYNNAKMLFINKKNLLENSQVTEEHNK